MTATTDKHYRYLYDILRDIASDKKLSPLLLFKGGTSLMFFHEIKRFSVDLDFTLVDKEQERFVYERILTIASKYGKIVDSNLGFFGPKVVLSYGSGFWNLKIEVSNRYWGERSETLTYDSFSLNVMSLSDMYAHKLIALEERTGIATRDIYDICFFEQRDVFPNEEIIMKRKGRTLLEQLAVDIKILEEFPNNRILSALAPLLEPDEIKWCRTHLLSETISSLQRRASAERVKLRFKKGIAITPPKGNRGLKR